VGLQQLNFAGLNKIEVSIMRLREFEPKEGYYLAFSGGKDSEVVYDLAVKSGVKFDAHYNDTTVDPPELKSFIRKYYPTVDWTRPNRNMFRLIEEKGLPTRKYRKCCEELKEGNGEGRFIVTGVRSAESAQRARRKMVEVCTRGLGGKYLHPIIDWSVRDVWDYIHQNKLPYCCLYDEGFKRLGCVLCPMESVEQTQIELNRWPKIAEAYRVAIGKLFLRDLPSMRKFKTSEEVWRWWLSRKGQGKDYGQCSMFI
jgi:phosphoadenosine phosphosulfate reductase